jgi:hypothetical protein
MTEVVGICRSMRRSRPSCPSHSTSWLRRQRSITLSSLTKELAQVVKDATGIRYDAQLYWLGKLLGPLVARCAEEGLPPLTALVVHAEGTVGAGYREVLEVAGEPVPDDLEALDDHAAVARLECYEFFDAELPPDGGRPTLTPRVKASREYKRAQAKLEEPPKLCPTCFTVLPMTVRCDHCE